MEVQNNPESETLKQLKQVRNPEALPTGSAPVEAVAPVETAASVEEVPSAEAAPAPVPEVQKRKVRIGGQEFESDEEAFRYAESLERDKLIAEAHSAGVQEALRATQPAPIVPLEEDFDLQFFADPKKALHDMKKKATQEALAAVQAENNKERLWTQFLAEYPDVDRADAELILARNPEIGQLTDMKKAMVILATRTRSYYQVIADRVKPRTELPNKGGQVVSAGTSATSSVTQQKKDEKPLTMAQQMKNMRRQA